MPAGLPPPRWQGQSQPASPLLLSTLRPAAGSLAADTIIYFTIDFSFIVYNKMLKFLHLN